MSEKSPQIVKPNARKSKAGYKAIAVFPDGKTKVLEPSRERAGHYAKDGSFIKGDRYAIGEVYETREEALEAAKREIAVLLQMHIDAREKHRKQCSPAQWEKSHKSYDYMVLLFGGTL